MRLFNIHSVAEHQKIEGGTIWESFFSKSLNAEKSERGDPLESGTVLRGKTKKPFRFSSLSQMFQFGTKKIRRTFKNYFGQFVWIKKESI